MFRTRPHGFRFFRTTERSYPSAYATEGIVGYNLEGPLHDSGESVTATLLHEVFHLNDEARGGWTEVALGPVFEEVVSSCAEDDACFSLFTPDEQRVEGGTYYASDSRTRDVREYGAELALRWFKEQREVLGSGSTSEPPFKCAAEQNEKAWRALVDEFFGG